MRFPLRLTFYFGEGMTTDNNYLHRTRVTRYGDDSSKIQLGNRNPLRSGYCFQVKLFPTINHELFF